MSKTTPASTPASTPAAPQAPEPEQAASAGTVTPSSSPEKASAPASGPQAAPAAPAATVKAVPIGIDFEEDPEKVLPGYAKADSEKNMKVVDCIATSDATITIKDKNGVFRTVRLTRHQQVSCPRWFALNYYPTLIIKD